MAAWNGATISWQIEGLSGVTLDAVTPDTFGCVWAVEDYTGWDDSPPPRPNRTDRPSDHGSFDAPDFFGSRIVSLTGSVWCPTPLLRNAATQRLSSAFTDARRFYAITRTTELGPEYISCKLDATTKIDVLKAADIGQWFNFSMQVAASDPRKYSTTTSSSITNLPSTSGGLDWVTSGGLNWVTAGGLNWGSTTSSGQIVMTNTGTADTWPKYTISAGANDLSTPGITIVTNGNVLFYNASLVAGDVLVINTNPANRYVQVNGIDRRLFLSIAQWSSLPANSTTIAAFSAATYTATATLKGEWQNANW